MNTALREGRRGLRAVRWVWPLLFCLAPSPVSAQTVPGLGTISFPTSTTSPAAQSSFVRGVLLLHLFHYEEAAQSFRAAEKSDSGFAMAYWGEAMTYTHPVWDEQDSVAGRAALAKLKGSGVRGQGGQGSGNDDPLAERGFVHAVEILYGAGSKARRDTLYSEAMEGLLRAHPRNDEVRLFYALSLLGLGQGVRDVPTYLRAAAMAESVFVRNPQNPGAAHYWIHAMDDPEHAAGALLAARALSRIAPDADHAQHMTSHIFMALGMWDDVVAANENAMRMVTAEEKAMGRGPGYCGHYNAWLDYGYLQQGRIATARTLLEHCREEARGERRHVAGTDPDRSSLSSYAQMWTRYVIDAGDWTLSVAELPIDTAADAAVRLQYAFTHAYAALERGDLRNAAAAIASFDSLDRQIARADSGSVDPETLEFDQRNRVLATELQGLFLMGGRGGGRSLDTAFGRTTARVGLAALERAAVVEDSMVYEFGPPFVDKPAHELLGEALFGVRRYKDAEREFKIALKRTPRRVQALVGLARAESGGGREAGGGGDAGGGGEDLAGGGSRGEEQQLRAWVRAGETPGPAAGAVGPTDTKVVRARGRPGAHRRRGRADCSRRRTGDKLPSRAVRRRAALPARRRSPGSPPPRV